MKLDFLQDLYTLPPPYASLYLDTTRDSEDAAKAVELRWRQARTTLIDAGADHATVDAIEEVVAGPDRAGGDRTAPGRAVFAAGGKVGYTERLPVPPRELAVWSPLPQLRPMLSYRAEPLPHLQVLVDRQGADITVLGARSRETTVQGRDWPIQKVREGGLAEARYQRSAVETWEANAKQVAEVVAREAADADAKLIIIAGDVRARELLHERLAEPYRGRVVIAEHGGRAAGVDEGKWAAEVATVLAEYQAGRRGDRVAAFREGHGRGDAVTGLTEVVTALRGSQADVVLLNDVPHHHSLGELWYGTEPTHIAPSEAAAKDLGITGASCDRADAVLVWAMASTGAKAELVGREELDLTDGVGALLRYSL